ncbi:membrane fusion protein, Cu(I)/Ag(I) efflux system [Cupriavidus sp. YR651]|uniref:efflux RND transporter periplasmic adaptor subunit n=1 Tax=Cupriavidus sp. YR651 TaxID=1855315 RepID=UPI000891848D|nr:efflux RND transporter periplasmic adaptor subunit [Cupriavidus sp. YR651]SDC54603.1 membrane fusion protein, Cu(I)/Ag(I) efflux system [Cupriavidus sp. YR651]
MKDRAMLGTGAAAVLLLSAVVGVLAMQDSATDPFIGHALASSADTMAHVHAAHANHNSHMHGAMAEATPAPSAAPIAVAKSADGAATQYTCPMHANILLSKAGSCPICGMRLVKVGVQQSMQEQAAGMASAAAPVTIDVADSVYRQLGVAVEVISHQALKPVIQTYAVLESDQGRATTATPKFEGWVKRLGVSAVGEKVRRGQVLYDFYSAEAQQRQRDYIDLLTRRDSLTSGGMSATAGQNNMLTSVAREIVRMRDRLHEAEIPNAVIDRLESERRITEVIPVTALADGVVSAINVRVGGTAGPNQPVLTYSDPRGTSVTVTLYPDQLPQLANGGQLTITSDALPGWRARTALRVGAAEVDPVTRRARVRVPLQQVPATLVAGTVLQASIEVRGNTGLAAPRDAVLRTGHGNFVMVSLGNGRFAPTEVQLGKEDAERVEITDGLEDGAAIAVNGQFLLGAEASLAATRRRMSGGATAKDVL